MSMSTWRYMTASARVDLNETHLSASPQSAENRRHTVPDRDYTDGLLETAVKRP